MSNFRPDISLLLNQAFRLAPGSYIVPSESEKAGALNFSSSGFEEEVFPEGRNSMFGQPILFPFRFKSKTYKRLNHQGELIDFPLPDFDLPATTMVDFSRSKIIVKTDTTSSDSTVKEFISFSDWNIRVRGLCLFDRTHPTSPTATQQYQKLLQWEQVAGHVEIVGDLFTDKGIHAIVIESFSVSQIEGSPGVIPFEMNCTSDTHPDIFIL